MTDIGTVDATDQAELLSLYAEYAHAVDARDGQRWIRCWTEDGEFVPGIGTGTAGRPVRGHDELASFAASRPDGYRNSRILTVNHLFERAGGHVRGSAYALVVDVGGTTPRLIAHVIYHDVIVRDGGRWRFRSRRPVADVESPDPS